jgi:hypothetical protein
MSSRRNAFGHEVRSGVENHVCQDLSKKGIPHEHRSASFDVVLDSGRRSVFVPDIVIAYEGNTIIIQCVSNYRRGDPRIRKLRRFKKDNLKFYHIIIAAPKEIAGKLPKDSYDDLVEV